MATDLCLGERVLIVRHVQECPVLTAVVLSVSQDKVDELYRDYDEWTRRSILYTATAGFFSSDRTIHQYAADVWDIVPMPLPSSQ